MSKLRKLVCKGAKIGLKSRSTSKPTFSTVRSFDRAAVTKCQKSGLNNRNLLSQVWKFEVQDQGASRCWFLLTPVTGNLCHVSLSLSGGLPATPDWQRSFSNSFPSQIVTNLSSYFEVATLPSGDSSRSPTGLFGAQTPVCLAHRLCEDTGASGRLGPRRRGDA